MQQPQAARPPPRCRLTPLPSETLPQASWYSPSCFFLVQLNNKNSLALKRCSETAERKSSHSWGGWRKVLTRRESHTSRVIPAGKPELPAQGDVEAMLSPPDNCSFRLTFHPECPQAAWEETEPPHDSDGFLKTCARPTVYLNPYKLHPCP